MCLKRIFKKKPVEAIFVKLSDESVNFIKNVVIKELNITTPIGVKEICDIEDWIYELEDLKYDDDLNRLILDENMESKIISAQKLLADLTGIWGSENSVEDLDDLNERLGFK